MLNKIVLLVTILLCSSTIALAEKTIVFAVPATVPPMAFVSNDGKLEGYSVDYVKAMAEAVGFTPVFKNIPWGGIFAGLVAGEYDAICGAVSITEKRQQVVDFSDPYFEAWQALAVPQNSSVNSSTKTLSDLKGHKVGGKLGSTGFFTIQNTPGIEAQGFQEISILMEALNSGQVAAIVYDQPQVAHYIKTQYRGSLKIASMVDTGNKDFYGIAVKKENSEILDLLNKGIKAVKDSGKDKGINQKWLDLN